jgi:hypothetical protein
MGRRRVGLVDLIGIDAEVFPRLVGMFDAIKLATPSLSIGYEMQCVGRSPRKACEL